MIYALPLKKPGFLANLRFSNEVLLQKPGF